VMPTSVAPRAPTTAAQAAPVFGQPPPFAPPPAPDGDADEERPLAPGAPAPNPRGPIFNTFPQPQVVNPQAGQATPTQMIGVPGQPPLAQPAQPATYPGAPTAPFGGVSVPGMIAPAAPQPGQPGQMVLPLVRRPDGPGGP
jgi:hypothetical protein